MPSSDRVPGHGSGARAARWLARAAGAGLAMVIPVGVAAQMSPCDYRPPAGSVPDSFPNLSYGPLRGSNPDLPLGVGHLGWNDGRADWYRYLVMPLFLEPRGRPFGWFARGWMVRNGTEEVVPFGFEALVETGYELPSFIVDTQRSDGWVRLRYGAPGAHLTAWVNDCAFEQDSTSLAVETWAERFQSDEISPLYFRRAVRHALRAAPDVAAERLRWVPADQNAYHLQPLEIRGDWMRVIVVAPSDNCVPRDEVQASRTEGWIRWYDAETGPWLWYPTRGC